MMEPSILVNTKKILGLNADYTSFDLDILTHINAAFSTLHQLGIGPSDGFSVEDDTTEWNDFLANGPILNTVKSYIYLKVRMLFDPPSTSFAIESMKQQIEEFENRLVLANELTESF